MNDIPDFEEAVEQFSQFLTADGQPDEIVWVFRDDVWKTSLTQLYLRYPSAAETMRLARKVFAEGRQRGLIAITAIAATTDKVVATVWFPKYPEEEVQGWNIGMKLSITQPLPQARVLSAWQWRLVRFLPRFQQYQNYAHSIGARAWAAA